MLPKIDVPVFETTLVSTGEKIKYRPFLVKEQKLFMMAMESQDPKEQMEVIKQVLNNCIVSKNVDVDELPMFDLEHLFMHLRGKSVGEVVNLNYTCNNKVSKEGEEEKKCGNIVKIDVNINDIKPIVDLNHNKKIEISEKMGLMMRYPTVKTIANSELNEKKDEVESLIEIIINCIDYIYDDEQIYYAKDSDKKELFEFVENLKQSDLTKIQNFFNTMPKIKKELDFKCDKCGYNEKMTIEGMQNFFA